MTYKVLIVDDSKLARMFIEKALNALQPDWIRVEAANADEASMLMAREQPDIALLDINMPGRDGLELAAEFSAGRPEMPIAIISANSQEEIIARTREVGATFLPKPLSQRVLAEFLSAADLQLKGHAR
jgi:DNA-binding NarL/FixJ family response regulator